MIKESKEHLDEVVKILRKLQQSARPDTDILDPEYLKNLEDFVSRYRYFTPDVYVTVNKGIVESIYSNCSIVVNLFDKDANYDVEERTEWEAMLSQCINNNTLKLVYGG